VNRVRIAELLGKFPHEVDAMPYSDYCDLIAVRQADVENEKRRAYLRGKR
jgi:hypothetical protein